MARPYAALFLAAVAALACAPGCTCSKTSAPEGEPLAPASALAPVPAPDGLLADVRVSSPNASWQKLQRGVGGALGILPSTLGGLVCALAGLDPALGPEIDGAAPIAGAVADDPKAPGAVAWALAMKMVEPRRAKDLLTDADTARYTARALEGMTVLVPKGGASLPVSVALAPGGYLLLARSEGDLARLGPYAYRTVPTKAPPETGALVLDAPAAALKGPIRARALALWDGARAELARKDDAARAAHGGRAPDYGDPRAILAFVDGALQSRLALLADLDRARLVVDVLDASVRADLAMSPGAPGGPASLAVGAMRPGDAAPLLEAADSPLAVLFRDDEAGRARTALDVEDALVQALGERLAPPAAARVRASLDDFTKARGDWMAAGLLGASGLSLRAPVADPAAADHALRELVSLAGAAPLKQALRIRDVTAQPNGALIAYGEAPAKGAPGKSAQLAWANKAGELSVALTTLPTAAAAASSVPSALAPPPAKLGDAEQVRALVRALGATVTFAAVAQPLKLDPARASSPAAPLVVAWGRRDQGAYLRLESSDALVRELVRMRAGF